MIPMSNSGKCVELRTAQESDLPAVLRLLGRAHLPTAGVADAPSHFVMAESDGKLVGVVGLDVRRVRIAPLRGGGGELAGEQHYFPRSGFACVSRDSVTPAVQSSIEFQEACPASATVMRKSLR